MQNSNSNAETVGKVVSVQGPVVDVQFDKAKDVPNIFYVIKTLTADKEEVTLEVAEHLPGNIAITN